MWLESKEHLGSTFYFTIPSRIINTPHLMKPPLLSEEHKGQSVLVMESNVHVKNFLTSRISMMDLNAVAVENEKEAIHALDTNPNIKLAIIDCSKLYMEAIENISKHVPVIDMGYAQLESCQMPFLKKPIYETSLWSLICRCLQYYGPEGKRKASLKDAQRPKEFAYKILVAEDNRMNQRVICLHVLHCN
jgi:DNA-binding NtrC family response regulator